MAPKKITLEVLREACDSPGILWDYLLELMSRFPEYDRDKMGEQRFVESLPRGLQLCYFLVLVDGEILNGGIRQIFWNRSEWFIEQSLIALDAIGATQTADNLRSAIRVFESREIPGTLEEYFCDDEEFLSEPTLNAIDAERCTDEGSYRDYALLIRYMRENPEQFLHG